MNEAPTHGQPVPSLDTDRLSTILRARAVRRTDKRLLISILSGSSQQDDLSREPNCGGVGRVHTFRDVRPQNWPHNPLPMAPASLRLGRPVEDLCSVQVFQNAVCNWRCWYCYVPFNLLAARPVHSTWLSADELVARYLAEPDRRPIIDCSGGQPDLTPEWVPWMMQALIAAGLQDEVYLWSDDNLSTDFFWRYLSSADHQLVADYRNYGRGCCFKGFDEISFHFNTRAHPSLFSRQFSLVSRYLALGIDVYAYVTLTGPDRRAVKEQIPRFVDRLQMVHPRLPLRVVPLHIKTYGVVAPRVREVHRLALRVQEEAINVWNTELERRFNRADRAVPIAAVSLCI